MQRLFKKQKQKRSPAMRGFLLETPMRKTTPSELIEMIDLEFAEQKREYVAASNGGERRFDYSHRGAEFAGIVANTNWLRAFIRAADELDWEKFGAEFKAISCFEQSLMQLRAVAQMERVSWWKLSKPVLIRETPTSAIEAIYSVLSEFRDLPIEQKWPEIAYLAQLDPELWSQLNKDLGEAHSSLVTQNWKAATVVAASVMEALL
jgi:hypothetical protein